MDGRNKEFADSAKCPSFLKQTKSLADSLEQLTSGDTKKTSLLLTISKTDFPIEPVLPKRTIFFIFHSRSQRLSNGNQKSRVDNNKRECKIKEHLLDPTHLHELVK